jgi:hypothetical protein
VKYRVELSDRAARDLDRLGRDVQERMMRPNNLRKIHMMLDYRARSQTREA